MWFLEKKKPEEIKVVYPKVTTLILSSVKIQTIIEDEDSVPYLKISTEKNNEKYSIKIDMQKEVD